MQPCREKRAALVGHVFVDVITTLFIVALVGTSHADEDRDAPRARPRPASLTFKAVRSDDGRPVAEARIGIWLKGGKQNVHREIITDADGQATFEYPNGDQPVYLTAVVKRAGLVPYYVDFGQSLIAAALPTEKTIRLDEGKTIGGKVVDPDGRPIAGAQLSIVVPAKDTPNNIHYPLLDQQTADDGTWQFDGAPAKLAGLQLRIEHPQFIRSSQSVQDRVDGRYELDRGLTLTGRVLDQNGKPVAGAHISVGRDRWRNRFGPTAVDQEGAYSVAALSPESTIVTVEAPGFSPQVKPVVVTKETKSVDFELEPGHTTRFQVIDIEGKPLAGIRIIADTWNGFRSLWWEATTDAKGLATWTGAPADIVAFHVWGQGYAARRDVVAAPKDKPHVVELRLPLKVEGVVSGPDKQKVPEFHVKTGRKYDGRDEIRWTPEGFEGRNGQFEFEYSETSSEIFIRVEAKGFQPWTSGAIPFADGQHKLFVRLVPGTGAAGIVRLPDGTPAAGAQVVLLSGNSVVHFQDGFRARGGKQTVIADDQGRFEFTPVDETYTLIATHNGGYAEANDQDLAKSSSIGLQSWAKVEVTVRRASKPLAEAKVAIEPQRGTRERIQVASYGLAGATNNEGRITFDQVPPRAVNVTLLLEQLLGRNSRRYSERSAKVSLTPGGTAQVTLGGAGAVVTGKLTVTGTLPAEHRWDFNEAVTISTSRAGGPTVPDASDVYRALIASDGSFRIDDIPPGSYELQVHLTPVPNANGKDRSMRLGSMTRKFQVATDQTEVDLGVIEGASAKQLGVGQMAPLFVAEGINCGTVRLGELRGRLVLLDFWDSRSAPWTTQLPELKKLHQEFASDTRFHLVGLAMDTQFKSVRIAVEQREVPWDCAFVGSKCPAPGRYEVKVPPEKFLLDVDGKILYRGGDLDVVAQLIRKRLAELPEKITPLNDRVGIVPTTIDDEFKGTTPIAVVAAANVMQSRSGNRPRSARPEATLRSEDGTPIRTLEGISPDQWLARSSQIAFDQQHGRLYFCNTQKQILATNRVGCRLFVSDVPGLHAAAVDERTGDVWCLALDDSITANC